MAHVIRKYDVIVVGAGLIGSAAARHLVKISKDVKVLLIGPEEPKVMLMHSPPNKVTNIFTKEVCEGYVFTGVCQSTGAGGGIPACLAGFQAHTQGRSLGGSGRGGLQAHTQGGS